MLSFETAERLAAAVLEEGARLGVSSRAVAGIAARVPAFFEALAVASQGRMFPAPGGVLLRDQAGEIVGAAGVSGDNSDVDEAVGIAGARAAGLEPDSSTASA
jgi:uncharacterized protein GlcG (DUF336 family)